MTPENSHKPISLLHLPDAPSRYGSGLGRHQNTSTSKDAPKAGPRFSLQVRGRAGCPFSPGMVNPLVSTQGGDHGRRRTDTSLSQEHSGPSRRGVPARVRQSDGRQELASGDQRQVLGLLLLAKIRRSRLFGRYLPFASPQTLSDRPLTARSARQRARGAGFTGLTAILRPMTPITPITSNVEPAGRCLPFLLLRTRRARFCEVGPLGRMNKCKRKMAE